MKLAFTLRRWKFNIINIILHNAIDQKLLGKLALKLYELKNFHRKRLIIVPLSWLDKSEDGHRTLLKTGKEYTTYSPHFMGKSQSSEKLNSAAVYYYKFKNARISSHSSSVILNDKKIIIERAQVPDKNIHDYSCDHIRLHNDKKAIVFLSSEENLKHGIFLGGNGSGNYYHWMLELLTKIELISKLPSNLQNYPILVSEEINSSQSLKSTLDIFLKNRRRPANLIFLRKNISYIVDELIYINSLNNLPFNLCKGAKFKFQYSSLDPESIKYLRDTALSLIDSNSSKKKYSRRIFLARKNTRRNFNQDEVFRLLNQYGFTKILMEDLNFLEQVEIINHADFIVGPTGAAWTNLIFSHAGSKALCWMAEEFYDFSAYANIAKIVEVDLRYITYKADVFSTNEIYSKEYVIDVEIIENSLNELGLQVIQRNFSDE